MDGVTSEQFDGHSKTLLEKLDRQIKLNENIENELKKINERLEQTETARLEAISIHAPMWGATCLDGRY